MHTKKVPPTAQKAKKLLMCSFGLNPMQINMQTLAKFRDAGKVFFIALDEEAPPFITANCRAYEMVGHLSLGEIRKKIFAEINLSGCAAVVTYGEPAFMCNTTEQLRLECHKRGVEMEIVPAISSFNVLCAMLGLNLMHPNGLYICGINSLHSGEVHLDPEVPALVFQPVDLLLPTHAALRSKFFAVVKARYSPKALVFVVEARSMTSPDGKLAGFTVGTIDKILPELTLSSTLYLPGKHGI